MESNKKMIKKPIQPQAPAANLSVMPLNESEHAELDRLRLISARVGYDLINGRYVLNIRREQTKQDRCYIV